jgi:hypothetical protein
MSMRNLDVFASDCRDGTMAGRFGAALTGVNPLTFTAFASRNSMMRCGASSRRVEIQRMLQTQIPTHLRGLRHMALRCLHR